jgi:integrase
MASASIRPTPTGRYQVHWRLNDGTRGGETFERLDQARARKREIEAAEDQGGWVDPRRGKISFDEWVDEWWPGWADKPGRSPKTLQSAEGRLGNHLRPYFGRKQLRRITVSVVQRWQNDFEASHSYALTMACRSLLFQIMGAAVRERFITSNPVAEVEAPTLPVDPEVVFNGVKPRTYTPEQFGHLLVETDGEQRDHMLILVGTGLRAGEFCGMHVRRVNTVRKVLEVLDTRYEAGKKYGSGYKDRPKSDAGIRIVPLCPLVAEAVERQSPPGRDLDALAFTGPGGGYRVRRGARRTALSVGNLRRAYKRAVERARTRGRLVDLDLRGPHDLRHTFATWLEDAGIPARVIDELMGHRDSRRGTERDARGSRIGTVYRHTTAEMQARVREAIGERLSLALKVADELPMEPGNQDETKAAIQGSDGR